MNRCNLVLHCGAHAVPRSALQAVRTPAGTPTWQPIPHDEYVECIAAELPRHGLAVVQQAHALTHDGGRYFGLMQIDNGCQNPDYSWVLGLRNSHDKSLPAGLVAGSEVLVCDNLAFSGEVEVSRKHTANILRDLPALISAALGHLLGRFREQDRRVATYKASRLSDCDAHDLTVKALDTGVICASRIPEVLYEWRQPRHLDFRPRTTWSWFNAVTETLKGGLHVLPTRTQQLYRLCDTYSGYVE